MTSRASLRKNKNSIDPLKSTAELDYLDSARVCVDNRYTELGPELICSICQNVLWKPVACVTCENAFCGGCIRTWVNKQPKSKQATCPFNCAFEEKRPPPILISLLSKLQIYCAYASNGCEEILSYDALEKHEQTCQYERTPCQICQTPVSRRDQNNKHELRQCFKEMYDRNPDYVQAQFIKLLDVVEASQRRIQTLEKLLGIESQENT
ncbi:unnamed protein product [Rotaria sp. Silwood2]|nr:unnamed protein product [Rotaria sp. Silwood2]CAF3173423.1 unnamed protein product [Rotaria sp. Silwood2]CAF3291940.1 unnamed protein product [Rotaria sp. Silwood2]CAF4460287.1 unnamed protein product [Rotaria sp. Silwood2]CAF4510685.1 unnamed protein product [Rotaria sp. Silwood2]